MKNYFEIHECFLPSCCCCWNWKKDDEAKLLRIFEEKQRTSKQKEKRRSRHRRVCRQPKKKKVCCSLLENFPAELLDSVARRTETFWIRRRRRVVQHKFLKCEKRGMIYLPNIKCIYLDFYAYLMGWQRGREGRFGGKRKWELCS